MKRRKMKGKGEKKRYTYFNTEFQRLAISSRKLKIPREHFMQRWARKRTEMDLTEAEDIKKRWQDYTENLYKKDHHDPDDHNGDHPPRARHPGMLSQVVLRKPHYEQS